MTDEKLKLANQLSREIELMSELSCSKPMPIPKGRTPIVKITFGYAYTSSIDKEDYTLTSDSAVSCAFPVRDSIQRALERAILESLKEYDRSLKIQFENL